MPRSSLAQPSFTPMQTPAGYAFAAAERQLRLSCPAASERGSDDVLALRAWVQQSPYANWDVPADTWDTLAERLAAEAEPFEAVVAQRVDARYTVDVALDASTAWLNLTVARGGEPPSAEAVMQTLLRAGVVSGIKTDVVQEACDAAFDQRFVVAQGLPRGDGENTRFELLVKDARDRSPQVGEDDLIDYRELGDIPLVQAGDALMRRFAPTVGADGRNVRGDVLPGTLGLNQGFESPLQGAAPSPADPDVLVALITGQPVRSERGVNVEKLLTVPGVNMGSGNVHFDGSVLVNGDVGPGMKVQATGDITIKGLVEGGHIEAGGAVQIGGGVIAHGTVKAAGAAAVRFAESARIEAGTVIVVGDIALHSDLHAVNQVLIGGASGAAGAGGSKGRLVGGTTRATMLIRTGQLGAEQGGGITKVWVGLNARLEARKAELAVQAAKQKAEEEKLQMLVTHLSTKGDPKDLLPKVRATWQQALAVWGQTLSEINDIEAEMQLARQARIEVGKEVLGEIDITFINDTHRLRRTLGPGAFILDGEEVFYADVTGQSRRSVGKR
jgi:uncharacterized protein